MTDVKTAVRRKTRPGPVAVNTALFLEACRARGAPNYPDRGALIGATEKLAWQCATGKAEHKYYTAPPTARRLGLEPSDLWPGEQVAA